MQCTTASVSQIRLLLLYLRTRILATFAEINRMQEPDKPIAHACFRLDIKWPLSFDESLDSSTSDLFELWHSLSYRILRQPADLLAHTRRIRLCTQPALRDRLAGALMDLDYVLGERGYQLRVRLQTEALQALGDNSQPLNTSASKGRVLPSMTQMLQPEAVRGNVGASQ